AAFEPGSVVRITLEAELTNENGNLNELENTASFASDPASPIFGSTLYAEDTELISTIAPDSMVINKQVSPTSAQPGDTITYTIEVINNGPTNGIGAVMVDTMPTNLMADNPSGYQNISCEVISTAPPLLSPVSLADCNNVAITNNGIAGFVVNFTGDWLLNTGYRFIFNAIAPEDADSVENTAVLTPPPSTAVQRFNGVQDSTTNFRILIAYDYGDLPDSFDTTNAADGPYHLFDSDSYLGSCIDSERDGVPTANASGDDSANSGFDVGTCSGDDDEDGVALTTPMIAGNQACVTVTANNDGAATTLYGWIDFNGDGDFDGDANEALDNGSGGTGGNFSGGSVAITADVTAQTYCFEVPAAATFDGGETHMRFRLTRDDLSISATPWNGAASDGEVEDYYQSLVCAGNYLFMDVGTTANVQDAGDTTVADGTTVNLVWGGADGDISTTGDN
ncbi:MAG: DUF11 domain-containing protein, partial [Methylococcales bacterium]|nr:DUF11 domain-containing protein [Methylococcales bacterium]